MNIVIWILAAIGLIVVIAIFATCGDGEAGRIVAAPLLPLALAKR